MIVDVSLAQIEDSMSNAYPIDDIFPHDELSVDLFAALEGWPEPPDPELINDDVISFIFNSADVLETLFAKLAPKGRIVIFPWSKPDETKPISIVRRNILGELSLRTGHGVSQLFCPPGNLNDVVVPELPKGVVYPEVKETDFCSDNVVDFRKYGANGLRALWRNHEKIRLGQTPALGLDFFYTDEYKWKPPKK